MAITGWSRIAAAYAPATTQGAAAIGGGGGGGGGGTDPLAQAKAEIYTVYDYYDVAGAEIIPTSEVANTNNASEGLKH
jgi:hypothetical protein